MALPPQESQSGSPAAPAATPPPPRALPSLSPNPSPFSAERPASGGERVISDADWAQTHGHTANHQGSGNDANNYDSSFVEPMVEDMRRRWQNGERPLTEEYLNRHPRLWGQPEAAVELVYEEVCLRRQYGEEAGTDQIVQRFPRWRPQLEVMLECHRLLELELPRFPEVGDTIADFQLVAEVGRGAQGRAYLAKEQNLAGRPVVLKCVSLESGEHLSLARLQHTNIVPLFAVHEDASRRLRILCMPYFGGATLDRVLEAVRRDPVGRWTGTALAGAIRHAQAKSAGSGLPLPAAEIPAGGPLVKSSFTGAICWMGACLADALQYAQDRGLVHLDLKPSNILWTADGQPMLLDFHLARAPIPAGAQPPAWLGGTPAYMAPEQQLALAAVRQGTAIPESLDGRTDIYGLGAVLYEALGGALPIDDEAPGRALRRRNTTVSVGLADVIEKCLAREPQRRYSTAAALAADLRRHLADQPLVGVRNRSIGERWRKWRRRRPNALAVLALVLTLLVMGTASAIRFYEQHQQALTALVVGRGHIRQQQYGAAILALKGGLALVDGLPWHEDLIQEFRELLAQAQRAQEVRDLHSFVEELRALDATDTLLNPDGRAELALCRRFWAQRNSKFPQLLSASTSRELLASDLMDLAICWINLELRLAPAEEKLNVRRRALDVLAEAENLLGPSCVLARERQTHARALGLGDVAKNAKRQGDAVPPRSAWEHFALGRALYQAGAAAAAEPHLQTAVDMDPCALWPSFFLGKCALQLGRLEAAELAFNACIVLAPSTASYYYHRGLVYAARGESERAVRDFDRAITFSMFR